jgi:hypothetical protein
MKVLQSAGIGMGSGMRGASEPHSHEGQSISVEPASSDEVMGQLQPEEDGGDNALGFIKKMIGLRGGDTSQVDASHSHGDYEEEDHEHDHDENDEHGIVMVGEEDVEEGNKFTGELAKARKDGVQKGETMKVDGKEYPVKSGKKIGENADKAPGPVTTTKFGPGGEVTSQTEKPVRPVFYYKVPSGQEQLAQDIELKKSKSNKEGSAVLLYYSMDKPNQQATEMFGPPTQKYPRRINKAHDTLADLKSRYPGEFDDVDDPYSVLENNTDKEMCSECGGTMYEGHACGQEKLDEWANSPMGKSADEQFQTELDYMTKLISGGLNRMKQDQTTLPHTKVKTDIAEDNIKAMKKLAGI